MQLGQPLANTEPNLLNFTSANFPYVLSCAIAQARDLSIGEICLTEFNDNLSKCFIHTNPFFLASRVIYLRKYSPALSSA